MSIGKKETMKAVDLYNQLATLKEGLNSINNTFEFVIRAKDSWVTAPINLDTARALCQSHFNKRISELEEQLTVLGFDPNEAGA